MYLDHERNRFANLKIEKKHTIPVDKLLFSNKVNMYYSHLEPLSLVSWPIIKQDPIRDGDHQIGVRRYSKMNLTEFGNFFVDACIPEGDLRNR